MPVGTVHTCTVNGMWLNIHHCNPTTGPPRRKTGRTNKQRKWRRGNAGRHNIQRLSWFVLHESQLTFTGGYECGHEVNISADWLIQLNKWPFTERCYPLFLLRLSGFLFSHSRTQLIMIMLCYSVTMHPWFQTVADKSISSFLLFENMNKLSSKTRLMSFNIPIRLKLITSTLQYKTSLFLQLMLHLFHINH